MNNLNANTPASYIERHQPRAGSDVTRQSSTSVNVEDMRAALPVGLVDHGSLVGRVKASFKFRKATGKYLDLIAEDQAKLAFDISRGVVSIARDQLNYRQLAWRTEHGKRLVAMTQTHDQTVIEAEEEGHARWIHARSAWIQRFAELNEQGQLTDAEFKQELGRIAARCSQARDSLGLCVDAFVQETHESVHTRLSNGAR